MTISRANLAKWLYDNDFLVDDTPHTVIETPTAFVTVSLDANESEYILAVIHKDSGFEGCPRFYGSLEDCLSALPNVLNGEL